VESVYERDRERERKRERERERSSHGSYVLIYLDLAINSLCVFVSMYGRSTGEKQRKIDPYLLHIRY